MTYPTVQETLAARNELLEKFLAMQQEVPQQPEQEVLAGAGGSSGSFGPGGLSNTNDAGARSTCIGRERMLTAFID